MLDDHASKHSLISNDCVYLIPRHVHLQEPYSATLVSDLFIMITLHSTVTCHDNKDWHNGIYEIITSADKKN